MTTPEARVPTRIKLIYAAPSIAEVAVVMPIFVWLPKFYADQLLVPLGLMALAIATGRAADAITDPLMGWISDRTRTRWGRRRPYILVGGLLVPLTYLMLFSPPASLDARQAGLWFAVGFTALFLLGTVASIPLQALGAELSSDYNERTRIFGLRSGFVMLGTILGALLPWLLDGGLGLPAREAMPIVALGIAVLIWGLKILLVVQVHERPEFMERGRHPLVPGIRQALRNRPFRQLMGAYIVATLSTGISTALLPFFIAHVVQPENPSRLLSLSLVSLFVVGVAALPVLVRLSHRYGKVQVWRAALVLAALSDLTKLFIGPGDDALLIGIYMLRGVGLSAHFALPAAMFADVIDYDELHTGKRREAQYSAFWHMVPKFIAVPGAAVPLAAIGSLGYVPGEAVQSTAVILGLRLLISVPSFAAHLGGAWIARRFPLTPDVHRELLVAIEQRRRGEPSFDPLTGARLAAFAPAQEDQEAWVDSLSLRELRGVSAGQAHLLPRQVWALVAGSAALAAAGIGLVVQQVSDLSQAPGLTAILGVVMVGIGSTAALFHGARLGAAHRVARGELKPEQLARALIKLRKPQDVARAG